MGASKEYRKLVDGLYAPKKTNTTSVKFNGREIHNPFLRFLVILILFFGMILLFAVFIPLMLVTHPIFRLFGRRGNIRHEGNSIHLTIDADSFRRAK